jgi:uncharacterized protein
MSSLSAPNKSEVIQHSAIYEGDVWHQRLQPRAHAFHYRVAMLYLDLDELEALFKQSGFWSLERFNLLSLYRRDYHQHPDLPLKAAVHRTIFDATGEHLTGPVRMLTNPRYGGYLINPLTCYYCFDHSNQLRYVVAEVTNTPWRERHCYVLPVPAQAGDLDCRFAKAMHVSPFMPMQLDYDWHSTLPTAELTLRLALLEQVTTSNTIPSQPAATAGNTPVFSAGMCLQRRACTRANMQRLLWRFPLMTVQVVGGIYWQALRLWLKGIRIHPHPRHLRTTTKNKPRYERSQP